MSYLADLPKAHMDELAKAIHTTFLIDVGPLQSGDSSISAGGLATRTDPSKITGGKPKQAQLQPPRSLAKVNFSSAKCQPSLKAFGTYHASEVPSAMVPTWVSRASIPRQILTNSRTHAVFTGHDHYTMPTTLDFHAPLLSPIIGSRASVGDGGAILDASGRATSSASFLIALSLVCVLATKVRGSGNWY